MKSTATYSTEDNKLRLYVSERLDPDTYARVKAAGFIWAPRQDLFVAPKWTPDREDLLLELCGEIDDEHTSLEERAEERAGRFDGYSERRNAEAEDTKKKVSAIADNIPFGQPILVGHHSERHARRDVARIQTGMSRAVRLWRTAEYWESRAERVKRHASYKADPGVRARRIKGLEADKRRYERELKKAQERAEMWRKVTAIEDPAEQLTLALRISEDLLSYERRDALKAGTITPGEAAEKAIGSLASYEAMVTRWIEHFVNRLAYERVLLGRAPDEETKVDRTRKGTAALPLWNYKAERIEVRKRWVAGEVASCRQVTMTAAEYAKIHADHKGTRVSTDGSHRVRFAWIAREDVVVFLSDSKVHPTPKAAAE